MTHLQSFQRSLVINRWSPQNTVLVPLTLPVAIAQLDKKYQGKEDWAAIRPIIKRYFWTQQSLGNVRSRIRPDLQMPNTLVHRRYTVLDYALRIAIEAGKTGQVSGLQQIHDLFVERKKALLNEEYLREHQLRLDQVKRETSLGWQFLLLVPPLVALDMSRGLYDEEARKQQHDLMSRRNSVLKIASPSDVVAALSKELFLAQTQVPIRSKLSGKTVDAKELFIIMLETGLITDVNDPVTGRPFMIDGHFANRYSEKDLVRKYGTDSDMVRFIQDDRRLNPRNPVVLGGVGDPGFDAWRGAAKEWADRNVSRILFYPSELLGAAANTAAGGAYLINVEIALRDEMIAKAKAEERKWSREDEDALAQAMISWRQGVGIVQAAGIGITKIAARRAIKKAWAETAEQTGDYVFKHAPTRVFTAGKNVYAGAKDELRDFAFSVLMDPQTYKWIDLGPVPKAVAGRLAELGIKDAHKMKFVLETGAIRHSMARHGNKLRPGGKDQTGLELRDFDKLLDVIRSPDKITLGEFRNGLQGVRFEKVIDNRFVVIEDVRPGRGTIALKTFWIERP